MLLGFSGVLAIYPCIINHSPFSDSRLQKFLLCVWNWQAEIWIGYSGDRMTFRASTRKTEMAGWGVLGVVGN